ncbi:MAG: gamma-glutamyltransferase [Oceanococcaceae bacterium]
MRRTLFGQGLIGFGLCLAAAQVAAAGPSQAAIASAHPLATAAGQEMLEAGGNAFDAAIAIAAALAVVEPSGSGLGGGGFFLLHDAKDGRKTFLDARETAPGEIRQALYLNEEGKLQQDRLRAGPLAAGIPGLPAGLVHLARTRASLPLPRLLEPAIRHAREGFEVDGPLADRISRRAADLRGFPASQAVFLNAGEPLPAGAMLVQADLASTLQKLAAFGFSGFYEGPVAEEMVRSVRAAGGVWSEEDLRQYRVIERRPLILSYGDWQIVSAPPPSSGGLVLGEIFHMLELLDYAQQKDPGLRAHILVEAMRRAYFDRARYMGDPDYVPVPSRELLARQHAEDWLQSYSPGAATPSADLAPEPIASVGMGVDTTHFSVIDTAGNRVAATLSINYPLGAAFVAGRTGVLLNNEMDDFVIQPGVPNGYGLVGGEANFVEPGKRMLSSMTPTFLEGAERTAILGTPGGSRIITMVLHGLLKLMEGGSAAEAVALPRFHHQYLPDVIQHEAEALSPAQRKALQKRGHSLQELPYRYGNMQVVLWEHGKNQLSAAADPRGVGSASVFEPTITKELALP